MTITLRYEWDMGHRLPLHDGKCRRLHGHRYVAEVDLTGPLQTSGPGTGMVVDFYILKEILSLTIGPWDHRTMLWKDDPLCTVWDEDMPVTAEGVCAGDVSDKYFGVFRVHFVPTAENISQEIMRLVSKELISDDGRCDVICTRVRVYETPGGWAEVRS